jgi:hypothetical protein
VELEVEALVVVMVVIQGGFVWVINFKAKVGEV